MWVRVLVDVAAVVVVDVVFDVAVAVIVVVVDVAVAVIVVLGDAVVIGAAVIVAVIDAAVVVVIDAAVVLVVSCVFGGSFFGRHVCYSIEHPENRSICKCGWPLRVALRTRRSRVAYTVTCTSLACIRFGE